MTAFSSTTKPAVSGTLSGGTDTILLPQWEEVEISNLGANDIFVAEDSTVTPALGTAGTVIIPPGGAAVVRNPSGGKRYQNYPTAVINIKGTAGDTFNAQGSSGGGL